MTSSLKNSNCWIQPSSTSSAGAPASKFSRAKRELDRCVFQEGKSQRSQSSNPTDSTDHQHILYNYNWRNQSFGSAMCCGRLHFHFGTNDLTGLRWLRWLRWLRISFTSFTQAPTNQRRLKPTLFRDSMKRGFHLAIPGSAQPLC